jgi:hypothetical protein
MESSDGDYGDGIFMMMVMMMMCMIMCMMESYDGDYNSLPKSDDKNVHQVFYSNLLT